MTDGQLGIFWTPAGFNIPDIGTKKLLDVTDGDTPAIQMPIRMLSVDTPEVTARSDEGAARMDARFEELANWIAEGKAPVSARFAEYILPKINTRDAGSLQFRNGKGASAWFKAEIERRMVKPGGRQRTLFIRISEAPFDNYGRLLAYVAPNYSPAELVGMSREERQTFNFGLVASGWAASFILYPNIPGELDLPLFVKRASEAFDNGLGQWADALTLTGYEYRMCEKLYDITAKLVRGETLRTVDRMAWRSRYCADLRDRTLHAPEAYMDVPPPYRLWIWPQNAQEACSRLNLTPASSLTAT